MGTDGENSNKIIEGWLYLIWSNRFGLQSSSKRYFALKENQLNCFKAPPVSDREDPVRSAEINSCVRVTDNGRENVSRKPLFIFTLYNASNHDDRLKLGARSSEEAARWIHSFQEAALKECPDQERNFSLCSKRKWQSFRLNRNRGASRMYSSDLLDWTGFPSVHVEPTTADVVAPSPWTIFGCKNGLRLFKEARDVGCHGKHWDDHPAIMAVGVVDASSELVFQTVMSLGPSRTEWDFCFSRGSVIEHLDGHTDIIHKQLHSDWLPWGMKRRDLLLRRYWRREDDGTYVILYHSVFHRKCLPQRRSIQACLKSGGYVISPVNHGKQSVVKHMLAIDWKFWKSYLSAASARNITIKMLGRVAALREMFKAKLGTYQCSDFSSGELARDILLPQGVREDIKVEVGVQVGSGKKSKSSEEEDLLKPTATTTGSGSFLQLNEVADEFFDVPELSECDQNGWSPDDGSEMPSQDLIQPKLSSAAVFVKRLHVLAGGVQRRPYIDLREVSEEEETSCCYGATLPKDATCSMPCSWTTADPSTFLIRGKNYLKDHEKIKAKSTLMQMVGADWLKSDKREDDLAGRPGSFVQKYAAQGGNEFFVIVNIQVPGSTTYSLALYYMMDTPVEKVPLLERFIKEDDAYRNSRFKLIPYISKGSWIVKQSVGKKACLVGQALEINYFQGKNYLELGVDVGSSTVARGVVSLVLGYLNNLVIEMAFLIQGNSEEELPEFLLGTCRLNHLEASKSVLAK
ncbi:hypothetical protein AMTRI_Chr07g74800 [Amborella trichopoda]